MMIMMQMMGMIMMFHSGRLPGILYALDHSLFKQPYDLGSSLIGTG